MYIYSVSFTIDAIGGYGELLYKYEVLTSESNSTCILFEDYSTENSFGFQSSNPLNDRVLRITIKDQFENVTVYEILVDNAKVLVDGEILNSTGHRYEDNICTECGELYYSRGLNYVYLDDLDGYEISSIGSCKDEIIYIPDMYNDKPIVSIGKNAFKNSNIKGVYIPDSVLEIKEYAFYNSYKLREVFLSQDSQLKKIEQWAFSGCVMLSSFVLPANVEEMAQDSFFGCEKLLIVYNLSTLNVEKGTNREYFLGYYAKEVKNNLVPSENLKQEGDFIYYKTNSKTYLVSYVGDSNVIILPDTLNGSSYWIYKYAFSHLDINHLVISKGVRGFEGSIEYTFESSKENINSISVSLENTIYKAEMNCLIEKSTNKLIFACNNSIIPNYITAIGEGSFAECNGIKFIEIPSSVRVIENWAFYECRNLETIIINDGVEIIESFAFSLCTSLRSVSLPNTLITIKDNAFTNCYLLETIFIPKSVETIEGGAFKYFSALKNITVDEENSKYKSMDGALYSKDGKELILYPEGKNEKHIIIPEGVEIIGDYAFDDFDSLVSVTLPSTIKTIGYYAFSSCYNLEYVIITNNVSYIDHAAFGWCSKLTIYSYFPSQPENWDPDWNYSNRPVYWAGEWEYDTNGKPVPII